MPAISISLSQSELDRLDTHIREMRSKLPRVRYGRSNAVAYLITKALDCEEQAEENGNHADHQP